MESNKNFQCRYAKMNMDQHCINTDQENNMVIIKQEKPDLTEVFSESSKLHNGNQIKDLQNNKEETPQLDNLNDSGTRNLNTDISIKRETPDKQDEWIDEQEGIFFVDNDLGSNDIHCDTSSLSLRCDVNMKEEDVNEKKPENPSQPELVDKGIDQSCVPSSSKYLGLVKTEDDKVALDGPWKPSFHSIFENHPSIIGGSSPSCNDSSRQDDDLSQQFITRKSSYLERDLKKDIKEKKFQCDICEFKTAYRKSIKGHMKIHTGEINEKNIHCELCEFKTAHKNSFRAHKQLHVRKEMALTGEGIKMEREKKYQCDLCDFKTAYRNSFKAHKKNHFGEKDYHCHLCDYKSIQSGHLKRHLKVHSGEKDIECELCDYKTGHMDRFKVHMKSHTGEGKIFQCHLCEYKSYKNDHVKRHMLVHTKEKEFICSYCDFKTARRDTLKMHIKKHTGQKDFHCTLCDYKTIQRNSLKIHMQNHARKNKIFVDNIECAFKAMESHEINLE